MISSKSLLLVTVALLSAVTAASLPALALDLEGSAKMGRAARFGDLCRTDVERFCPALADVQGQTANKVICLKPYKASLSMSCRRAVNDTQKSVQK